MLARRLLIATGRTGSGTGGSGFVGVPASPELITLTAAPKGGWIPLNMNYPRAVHAGGKTFWGYIDGTNGDVMIASYDHATTTVTGPVALNTTFATDDHNSPVILVRSSDSRLVVLYCAQGAPTSIRKVISANPLDITNWSSETTFSPGGANYLYPNIFQMSVTGPGRIYAYWKDFPSNTHMRETTSSNGGSSFSGATIIWTSTNVYWSIASDGDSRIDYICTDIAPSTGVNNMYHFYQDTSIGQLYASNGSTITTPATPANATLIYDGAEPMWPYSLTYTADGRPAAVCATQESNPKYRELRYLSGSTWQQTLIATEGVGAYFGNQAQGIAQQEGNADRVILGKHVGSSVFEMFEYAATNDGQTWTQASQLTSGSGVNIQAGPTAIVNQASALAFLWHSGTYVDFDEYSVGTRGSA